MLMIYTVSKLPGSTKLRSILRQCGSKPYLTLPNALFGKNESSIYFDRIIFVSYLYFFSLVLYFWLLYYFSFIFFLCRSSLFAFFCFIFIRRKLLNGYRKEAKRKGLKILALVRIEGAKGMS